MPTGHGIQWREIPNWGAHDVDRCGRQHPLGANIGGQSLIGPATGTTRVLRGGAWDFTDPGDFRAAYRGRDYPTIWYYYYGFRCVLRSPGP